MSSSNNPFRLEIANEQSREVNETRLLAAVQKILEEHEIASAEISLALVDDLTMRRLNRQYLNHDYETDVLSFLLEYDSDREFLSGQLIVSTDTAARVAEELHVAMDDEVLLYVVHGTLHLVGCDDTDELSAVEMRGAERHYLQMWGVEHRWDEASSGEPSGASDSPQVHQRGPLDREEG